MAVAAVKTGNDQKKLILAVVLGLVAILTVWWAFIGFGGSSTPRPRNTATNTSSPAPVAGRAQQQKPDEPINPPDYAVIPVLKALPGVPEPRRNIFAYYVPSPTPTPSPSPFPSPSPPDFVLASISPSNVYARTDDFTLELMGEKFTPAAHVFVDNRQLTTRYISSQKISCTVPASLIANPGQRSVMVKTDDGKLSNSATLAVNAPPTPNYTYIGIIAKQRNIGDTALLQEKSSKEVVSHQRGDVIGGRFRVSSISERELVVVDTILKIKHTLPMTIEGDRSSFPSGRPTPRVQSEDDEP